jgi:hypothetical protein
MEQRLRDRLHELYAILENGIGYPGGTVFEAKQVLREILAFNRPKDSADPLVIKNPQTTISIKVEVEAGKAIEQLTTLNNLAIQFNGQLEQMGIEGNTQAIIGILDALAENCFSHTFTHDEKFAQKMSDIKQSLCKKAKK